MISCIKSDTFLCWIDTFEIEFTQYIPNTLHSSCVLFSSRGHLLELLIVTILNMLNRSIGMHMIPLNHFGSVSHVPIPTATSVLVSWLGLGSVQCCRLNLSITLLYNTFNRWSLAWSRAKSLVYLIPRSIVLFHVSIRVAHVWLLVTMFFTRFMEISWQECYSET